MYSGVSGRRLDWPRSRLDLDNLVLVGVGGIPVSNLASSRRSGMSAQASGLVCSVVPVAERAERSSATARTATGTAKTAVDGAPRRNLTDSFERNGGPRSASRHDISIRGQ